MMQKIKNLDSNAIRYVNMSTICNPDAEDYGCNCIICGKELKNPDAMPCDETGKTYWLHMTTTGYLCEDHDTIKEEYDEPDAVGQGWFQVGPGCYKKFLSMAKTEPVEEAFKTIG